MKKILFIAILSIFSAGCFAQEFETSVKKSTKLVSDPVGAIRTILPDGWNIETEEGAYPFYRRRGNGLKISLRDTSRKMEDRKSDDIIIYIMPSTYNDALRSDFDIHNSQTRPPALVATTQKHKIYLWGDGEPIWPDAKDRILAALLEEKESKSLQRFDKNSPLALTIKSDKQVYEKGEPIVITLVLMNQGKEGIFYGLPPFYEQPDYPDYPRLFLQNGENIVVKSKTRGIIKGSHIQQVPIEGALQQQVVIASGKEYSQAFTISRYFDLIPDVYEIYLENTMTEEKLKISGDTWTGAITSNTITIEVKEKKQEQPLALTIKSDKKVFDITYRLNEDIVLWLTLKNLASEAIREVPELIWSSKIILDGEEYRRKSVGVGIPPWDGPSEIGPNGEVGFAIGLEEYAISKEFPTLGKHNIAIKIGKTISNTVMIEGIKSQPLQLTPKSDKKVYEEGERIFIGYEVKNISKDKILMFDRFIPGLTLYCKIDKYDRTPPVGCAVCVLKGLGIENFFLEAGKSLKETYELGSPYTPEPTHLHLSAGKHTIKLTLKVGKWTQGTPRDWQPCLFTLISNTITIEVKEKR